MVAGMRRWIANPAYRFAGTFLIYLAIAGFGYPVLRRRFATAGEAMSTVIAWLEYWMFRAFSSDVTLSGKTVSFGGFGVEIIEECTAAYEILIFAAAVLAFPTSWAKRGVGLAMGIPLLYAINLLRIAMLIVVGRYWPAVFDFMHLYFWQATLILMITGVWVLWIVKVVRRGEAPVAANA